MSLRDDFSQTDQDARLVQAVTDGDLVAIVKALDDGANPNYRDPGTGRSLLFTILDRMDDPSKAENRGDLMTQFLALAQHGARGDLADDDGLTPLHYALDHRRDMLAGILLCQNGIDVNARDPRDGRTPFHKALEMMLEEREKFGQVPFEMLVFKGANPLLPDAAGVSALDVAQGATGENAEKARTALSQTLHVRQHELREKALRRNARLKLP